MHERLRSTGFKILGEHLAGNSRLNLSIPFRDPRNNFYSFFFNGLFGFFLVTMLISSAKYILIKICK